MTYSRRSALPLIFIFVILAAGAFVPAPARAQEAPAGQMVSVLLELSSPSAGEVYVAALEAAEANAGDAASAATVMAATAAAQAQVAQVNAEQQALAAALDDMGATTLYRAQRVYNGIAVVAPAEKLAALASLPGVAAIHPLIAKEPENKTGIPAVHAPELWGGSAGLALTGKGIRIGIIDTGIDYIHTDFGGSGTSYARNDPTIIGDVEDYPSAKVVDGYDFVGDTYNASPGASFQPLPEPDPDPIDCYGHGTHVAGTAGGYGVTTSGKTFDGPFDGSTPIDTLRIGPGVAPEAQLVALKVFGCFGSSLVVDSAIEWAVDPNQDGDFEDHLDVINMSLGSPFGGDDDTTAIAADRAARLGVIVVASAGNSGNVHFSTGSPGAADYAISVAATSVTSAPFSESLAGFSARGPRSDSTLKPDVAAPGANIVSAQNGSGSESTVLSGTSMAAPHVAGAMALLRQLHPTWRVEELKALIMNTAVPVIDATAAISPTEVAPVRMGSGRIGLTAASRSSVVAYNADAPGLVNLSFGAPDVLGSYSALTNVRLRNRGSAAQSYDVRYTSIAEMPGVEVSAPLTVIVPAGGTASLPVNFAANAAKMRNNNFTFDASPFASQEAWQSEESGLLTFWPSPATFSAALPGAGEPMRRSVRRSF